MIEGSQVFGARFLTAVEEVDGPSHPGPGEGGDGDCRDDLPELFPLS
jgi:hypothetical protein